MYSCKVLSFTWYKLFLLSFLDVLKTYFCLWFPNDGHGISSPSPSRNWCDKRADICGSEYNNNAGLLASGCGIFVSYVTEPKR